MSKEITDKRDSAATSQPVATAKENVQNAARDAQRWFLDILEDDDVQEALKSLHGKRTG